MVNKKLNQSLHRREKNFLMNDSEFRNLREGEELNKNGTLSPGPSPRGGWRNTQKPAITLAEIIIVIFIVGIIAGVFLAMPKKNVGQTDKAKYYVAYDMLKRLQDEQMAENGFTWLNTGTRGTNGTIAKAIYNRTNYLKAGRGNGAAGSYIKLTNGMNVSWTDTTGPNYIIDPVTGTVLRRVVAIDIDGDTNNICVINNQDCHGFILTSDGQVAPTLGDRTDWLTFKVYRFQDNGTTEFLGTNISYNDAITQYCCRNAINGCITASTDNSGNVNVNNITQAGCGANWNSGGPVFMEAIQPLGK